MDKINIPAWNHFPFLGYLHYKNTTAIKFVHKPEKLWLPPLNPYLGFINHAIPVQKDKKVVIETREIGTQTEPDKAMELGQQIIDKMGYD